MKNLLKNKSGLISLLASFPILVFGIIILIFTLISIGIISLTMGFGVVLGLIIMGIGVVLLFKQMVRIGVIFLIIGIIFIILTCYGIINLEIIKIN